MAKKKKKKEKKETFDHKEELIGNLAFHDLLSCTIQQLKKQVIIPYR